MSDAELDRLRELAEQGDDAAAAELVQLAGDRLDSVDLRIMAEDGGTDALDTPVRDASQRGDLDEMRRLAAAGDPDASDVLDVLWDDDPMDDGT